MQKLSLSRALACVVVVLVWATLFAAPVVAPGLRGTSGYDLGARDDVVTLLLKGHSRNAVARLLNKSWTHVDYTWAKYQRNGHHVSDFERGVGRTGRRSQRTPDIDYFLAYTVSADPTVPAFIL